MDTFKDQRGIIRDILGDMDGVTEIFTVAGAVRGNHLHQHTTQWTYIVEGRLLVATRNPRLQTCEYGKYSLIEEKPGIPHAWRAVVDTTVLVFSKGPRTGANFEKDVIRLDPSDHLLRPVPLQAGHPWPT